MTKIKSALMTGAFVAAVTAGALAAGTTAASADVACNRYNECWHVRDHYNNYPTNLGVVFHDEAWRTAHADRSWKWRHDRSDDHGYYSHGHWRRF